MQAAIKNALQKINYYLPTGIGVLLLIQIFSTFGFSILYSTLILYITDKLKISDATSTGIIASFFAFNYVLHLLGGYLGGKFFSNRVLLCIGMLFLILGCALLSIPSVTMLYWGLATFVIGTGTSTTCINCMITQLFAPDDKRRETAFLIMYSGINIFYFIGFGISGYFQLYHAYQQLFLLGTLGSLLAFLMIPLNWNKLNNINPSFSALPWERRIKANLKGAMLIVAIVFTMHWLFQHANFTNNLTLLVSCIMAGLLLFFAFKQPSVLSRNKIFAYLIFAVAALVFWTLYQVAPMALTLFIERNVDPHYLGMIVPPQWIRNVNSMVVMFGAPLIGIFFNLMRARGYRITVPLQFSVALVLIGLSFIVLPMGIYYADSQGLVAMNWIILSYFIQSIGELFISPIGYAMVGQLAPANLQGLMMGTWLMLTGIAAPISWYFSNLALGTNAATNPIITNPGYSYTFLMLGMIAIVAGIILFVLIPFMLRLTQENGRTATIEDDAIVVA